MKKIVILSIGLATAILTGCGSSSGRGNNTKTGTGYYIDSAVSGVDYVCGSKSGKTGADGSFTFEIGKNCTFSLGSMKLREVKAAKLKDQIKVLEDNLAVATLLQTLDIDGDPDNNGIVISEKVLAELKAKNITTLPTNQNEVAEIYEVIKNVDGYQGKLKNKTEVQTHLVQTQGAQLKELLAGKTFYNVSSDDGYLDKLSFNADMTSLTWITLRGNDIGETDTGTIRVEGNKFIDSDGDEYFIAEQTTDYLLLKRNGDGKTSRLYFNKSKAEAYFNSLSSGSASATDKQYDLKGLLAGKTFYNVSSDDGYLDKLSFNADMTSLTWITLRGNDTGETDTETIRVKGNKFIDSDGEEYVIARRTIDYLLINSNGKTSRYYFDKSKAEAYFNSLSSSSGTSNVI